MFGRLVGPAWKRFLLEWIVPPGLAAARRRRLIPPLQKFWSDAPLPVPPFERRYFDEHGLESSTATREDDTRPTARINHTARLRLPPPAAGQAVQVAVTTDAQWPELAHVQFSLGELTTTHSDLDSDRWLDVRLDVPPDATHLDVRTDAPVRVSCPRAVRLRCDGSREIRHVIVLVLDGWTTRLAQPEHPTEPDRSVTRNIDRFFADGLNCPNGYATGEWTLPTAASFFTGLHTVRHRAFHPYANVHLPEDRPVLAEYFQAAGYHTLCMSVANRLSPAYGHHRGMDRFIYHFPEDGFTRKAYDPAVWLSELMGHLDAHGHDKTFSYLHLPDVHPIWDIPPLTRSFNLGRRGNSTGLNLRRLAKSPDADAQGRQLYLLRLYEIDRALGSLFDYIERASPTNTLVVLTADHGTPWPHLRVTRPTDEPYLVDDRTAISFRMRGPNVPARRIDGLIAPTLDLMPTVLERVGMTPPGDIDGKDLLNPAYRRDVVISESIYRGVYEIAVRDGRQVYFEKYPLDEKHVRVTGPATYRRLFQAGCRDYGSPARGSNEPLVRAAHAHIERFLSEVKAA